MALLPSILTKIQFRAKFFFRLIHYISSFCLLLLFIRVLGTQPGIIARRQHEYADQRTAYPATKKPLLHDSSLQCPRGHFSFPRWSVCRPWLNCTAISLQVRPKKLIGGFRKKNYLADWKGRRVVYSKCAWPYLKFRESCLHGIKMMELLQSEFVTRLIGVCYERLEMVTEYHKYGSALSLTSVLRQAELIHKDNIETRLQLSVDYVKIINYLHNSPIGTRVMCDSHTLFKTMSQFLITDNFHLVVNDLDNLPQVNHAEGKFIKCVHSSEIRNKFVAPEQKWPHAPRTFNETLMPPYDEKTDIWKVPAVVNKILGNVEGSSFAKRQLRDVIDSCHRSDPRQRPGASELLQAFLRVQEMMKAKMRQREITNR